MFEQQEEIFAYGDFCRDTIETGRLFFFERHMIKN